MNKLRRLSNKKRKKSDTLRLRCATGEYPIRDTDFRAGCAIVRSCMRQSIDRQR